MIGKLLTNLNHNAPGNPISKTLLNSIIESPNHNQFAARNEKNEIIGIATLSVIISVYKGRQAWLEDFVVDGDHQGLGVGSLLWDSIVEWCEENEIAFLEFTSSQKRHAAHAFYAKKGATVRDTTFFIKSL